MGLLMHHQGALTDCQNSFGIVPVEGYDTRFIHYYFVVMYDQGIGRTQVHGYFLCQEIE